MEDYRTIHGTATGEYEEKKSRFIAQLSFADSEEKAVAFLEQVRGVDSSGVVASLLDKGLLEERGRLDVPGRPMQFGTTARFLRCFGLSSLEDLPPVDENGALIAQLQLEEQPEQP